MDEGLREQQRCGAIRNIIKSSGANLNIIRACTKRHMNLLPAGHEEGAIYEGNQRIPNGRRIAGAATLRSNP